MTEKIAKIALIIAGFVLTLSFISNTFDGDFGWHLRFGRDAFANDFQYTDSYTWPYFGQPWTNHEWGGDLLYWFLYANLGYFSLVMLIAGAIWGAFLAAQKTFQGKLTAGGLIISIIAVVALKFLLVMRLTFLALLCLSALWYILEQMPRKKTYYFLPPLLWIWSALHGSWVLGFIIIAIYIAGNSLSLALKKYYPKYSGKDTGWTVNTTINCLLSTALGALIIAVNPYGLKIWEEVSYYLSDGYFKQVITEWIPSYTYPVFTGPLIFTAFAAVLLFIGWREKKASLSQVLLFAALFYSAWKYKRNNMYLVLACQPILSVAFETAKNKIVSSFKLTDRFAAIMSGVVICGAIATIAWWMPKINTASDVWQDRAVISYHSFPFDAVKFLQNETGGKAVKMFNEFHWGGYLNWALPNALVYLDGRGTVTWKFSEKETMLEHYRKIKFEAGGFRELDGGPAEYVLIDKSPSVYPPANVINKILFGKKLDLVLGADDPPQIEKMLERSKNWQPIYEDRIAKIWKRITLPGQE